MSPILVLAVAAAGQPPVLVPAAPLPPAEAARRESLGRFGVGLLRDATDRPADAARNLEAAAKAAPESPAPLRPLVKVYADLGRDAAAIRTARKVLELDPADADTGHALGKLLFDGNQFSAAVDVLRRAADSPVLENRPAKKLGIPRDLVRTSERAADFAAGEEAAKDAIAFAAANRAGLLKSGVFPAAADLDREVAWFHEQHGKALPAGKKFAAAAAAFRTAADLYAKAADPTAAARLDWNLSGAHLAAGDPDAAVRHLDRFLALKPSTAAPYERLVEIYRDLRRPAELRGKLARLARDNPDNAAIPWLVAAADPGTADRAFRTLAKTSTDPAHFRIAVRAYREADQPLELLKFADELLRAAKGRGEDDETPAKPAADPAAVARARAVTDAIRADREASRLIVREVGGRVPDLSRETWDLVAALAERDGRLADAEAAVRRAGADRAHTLHLMELLAKQRKWAALRDEADLRINGTIGGRPLAWDVYKATALAELGGRDNVAAALDLAADVAKNAQGAGQLWARLQTPRILNLVGRHADAVAECEKLLKDFPRPADARRVRVTLADSLNGLKEFARAETELRAVLDDDPDDLLVLNNLGYNLADQGRKLDEAEAMIRRAIDLDAAVRLRSGNAEAESGVYLDSLGWVLFRRGKLADARAVLEKAVTLPDSATDAVVWDHLGDVAFRQGEKDRARAAWSKAVEWYANSHTGRQGGRRDEAVRKLKRIP